MSKIVSNSFTNDPEYIELVEFLVEKTKDATSPMITTELCKEFKEQSKSVQTMTCLGKRINRLFSQIYELPNIDLNTKVKLLFALSAPIDYGFLNELKENADITLDSFHRIIEYKEKNGGLELSGIHMRPKDSNLYDMEMMEFLAETAKQTDSPLTFTDFSRDFKFATGNISSISRLKEKFSIVRKEIFESADFDIETKIRMLFVSGTRLHDYVLEELRKNANVEVDSQNRITKYTAEDGSLILEGDQRQSAKAGNRVSLKRTLDISEDDFDKEDEEENVVRTKSGRLSKTVKREIDDFEYDDLNIGSSSNRRRHTRERMLKESMKPARRDKLESLSSVFSIDEYSMEFPEEALLIPKEEEIYGSDSLSLPPESEPVRNHTSQQKILETINYLVLSLDSKNLKEFQTKLEKKMKEMKNRIVPITGFHVALQSCFFMITSGVTIESTFESISLLEFFSIFKTTLLVLKFDGLQEFQEKLKEIIKELRVNDKKVPAEKLQSALQTTLDILAL